MSPVYLDVLGLHGDFAQAEVDGEKATLQQVRVARKCCCAECGSEIQLGELAWKDSSSTRKWKWCEGCFSASLRVDVDGQEDLLSGIYG